MWLIYLLLMLDNIVTLFMTVGTIAAIIWAITAILSIVGEVTINDRYSDWTEKVLL